jgi:hypothetical protein
MINFSETDDNKLGIIEKLQQDIANLEDKVLDLQLYVFSTYPKQDGQEDYINDGITISTDPPLKDFTIVEENDKKYRIRWFPLKKNPNYNPKAKGAFLELKPGQTHIYPSGTTYHMTTDGNIWNIIKSSLDVKPVYGAKPTPFPQNMEVATKNASRNCVDNYMKLNILQKETND